MRLNYYLGSFHSYLVIHLNLMRQSLQILLYRKTFVGTSFHKMAGYVADEYIYEERKSSWHFGGMYLFCRRAKFLLNIGETWLSSSMREWDR